MKETFVLLLQEFGGGTKNVHREFRSGYNVKSVIKTTNKMVLQALVE